MRTGRRLLSSAVLVTVGVLLAGCGADVTGHAVLGQVADDDLVLIHRYVEELNLAGAEGPEAQGIYLRDTQDPSVPAPPAGCLGRITLEMRLVDRTLRPDPDWMAPQPGGPPIRPAGAVYVVAAGVDAFRDGVSMREEIGSRHLVVRDGRVYGYSPCPR